MIVTVTMNPAIDKTVQIDSFVYGGLNRTADIVLDAGGKGINVSKTIKALGGETVCMGFVGGNNGCVLESMLEDYELTTDFIRVDAETRINTKIVENSGTLTELNEVGPCIGKEKQEELIAKLMQYATKDTWFVLAGSIACGMSKDIYREIIEVLHERGAKVFLDADGELFANAIQAKPDAIKPNRAELAKHLGCQEEMDEAAIVRAGKAFLQQGISYVIVSLGEEGAFFFHENEVIHCAGVKVPVKSTVGAGDAVVAAFCHGMDKGESLVDCIKLAMATSAGAVTTEGTKPPKREKVEELMEKIELKRTV